MQGKLPPAFLMRSADVPFKIDSGTQEPALQLLGQETVARRLERPGWRLVEHRTWIANLAA